MTKTSKCEWNYAHQWSWSQYEHACLV